MPKCCSLPSAICQTWEKGARDALLIQGDGLRALRQLKGAGITDVMADPPYSSGGTFHGHRTLNISAKYQGPKARGLYAEISRWLESLSGQHA